MSECCATVCFHCATAVARTDALSVAVGGEARWFCCAACAQAASSVFAQGLDDFYRFRTSPAPTARPKSDHAGDWAAFDRPEAQAGLCSDAGAGIREALVIVEGMRCAACAWLIQSTLEKIDGVADAQVNAATGRALLRWRPETVGLGTLLSRMSELGYKATPLSPGSGEDLVRREQRAALKRLAVAGLGMMQVMTFAVALYAGVFESMDPLMQHYFRLASLLVATPVVLYAGQPFFAGAMRDLWARRAGMDVPVALAIGIAYAASVRHSLAGVGEVYFDSATMFVFFLSLGRYAEMSVRHRAARASEALVCSLPATAIRITAEGEESVAAAELQTGDLVLLRPGDTAPADGQVETGRSNVDESLLTGESWPRVRTTGDSVIAGSVNLSAPLRVRVLRVGPDTVVAAIGRLLERARGERPAIARMADRIASRFVIGVLTIAIGVGAYWWRVEPDAALGIVLSVLVVTCPCALSLATPAALCAAIGHLARRGVLTVHGSTLEMLARANRVVFDKTGTLTRGKPEIERVEVCAEPARKVVLGIAAALEAGSAHPLAAAFAPYRGASACVTDATELPGQGIEGRIDGQLYRIGTPAFVAGIRGESSTMRLADDSVDLGTSIGLLARFFLRDELRADAAATVDALKALDVRVEIASGDAAQVVARLAARLGIERSEGRLAPESKLARLRALQARGDIVVMVGDGINDAPVLAGADVSIAAGVSAPLAQASADLVILGERLEPLVEALRTARRMRRVLVQNLVWALAYNALALPIAAAGLVQPWMAAIGMSASSLLVVANATRLARAPRGQPETGPVVHRGIPA